MRGVLWDAEADASHLRTAASFAAELAGKTEGRLKRRAQRASDSFRIRAEQLDRAERDEEHWERLHRIESNVTLFVLMKMDDENETEETIDSEVFAPIADRITNWRQSVQGCYLAGYEPVGRLERVVISEAEKVRLRQLMNQTVNAIVLKHAHVAADISDLRAGVPACLGYAATTEDIRFRELLGSLERHSVTTVELPSELAMTTSLLDAMEAAAPPADEREFFKLIAGAAFYVGVGAGLEDVIETSTETGPT